MLLRKTAIAIALSFVPHLATAEMQCDFLSDDYFSRDGFADELVACLERGYTFAIQDTGTGDTPVHLVAKHMEDPFLLDQMALLVPKEVREDLVVAPNQEGMNPFHLAVRAGRDNHFLASLSKWGDPINSVFDADDSGVFFKRGSTALHLAMRGWSGNADQIDRVLTLLALGADAKARDRYDSTPLAYARSDYYAASLLLDDESWREIVKDSLIGIEAAALGAEPSQNDIEAAKLRPGPECQSKIIEESATGDGIEAWNCLDNLLSARSDPASFWNLHNEGGDNFLHRLVKSSPAPQVLDAILGVADKYKVLEEALSSENIHGHTAIHLAASFAEDPLTIVQLVRWGADVNQLAAPMSNGFLKAETGEAPLHLAARREPLRESTRAITALLAVGADPNVYDNNFEGSTLEEDVGHKPIDYMNERKNFAAMALIGPGFSFCEKVDEYQGAAQTALGLGAGVATASGSATIASTAAGVSAVAHSSGAIILTGSSGYIAGTLGTFATGAFAFLTAPATLTAAGAVVVLTGGSVFYCSMSS